MGAYLHATGRDPMYGSARHTDPAGTMQAGLAACAPVLPGTPLIPGLPSRRAVFVPLALYAHHAILMTWPELGVRLCASKHVVVSLFLLQHLLRHHEPAPPQHLLGDLDPAQESNEPRFDDEAFSRAGPLPMEHHVALSTKQSNAHRQ